MQELLHHLDPDYYRTALLLVARTELERLRQERSTGTNIERRSNVPLSPPGSGESPETARASAS